MISLRAVLVDDERHALEALEVLLQKAEFPVTIVAKFDKPEEALHFLQQKSIDLLFLDIEMPRMNGFQLLSHWSELPFEVIFTTAYDQFALEAFKISAFDYLLKPIDRSMLHKTLKKFTQSRSATISFEQLKILQQLINAPSKNMVKVPLPVSDGILFVETQNIIRCEGDAGYTYVHLKNGKPILLSKTLKEVEEHLFAASGFIRVHQSHLINAMYLKKFVRGEGSYLIMDDGSQIPVSRRKKDDFLDMFR